MSVNKTAMNANKLIIPLSAVLLAAGLTALPESAFAKKCTKAERRDPPRCLVIEELGNPAGRIVRGKGFYAGRKYRITNYCDRQIKVHEDIKNAGDKGYKLSGWSPRNEMERSVSGWWATYRQIQCCDVKTPDYHYTCGERGET